MTNTEIIEIIRKTKDEKPLGYGTILFSKKNKEIADFIYEQTRFLDCIENINRKTRVFCILNNITELPRCKICGKTIKRNINYHTHSFAKYCSPKCENSDSEVLRKLNNTCIEKYGCRWSFQSENNIQKSKTTMLKRYGVEYAQQNKDIKKKSYKTMVERYGCQNPFDNREIMEKRTVSKRANSYKRFLKTDEVIPLFSKDDYIEHGNDIEYDWKCTKCGKKFTSFVNMSWFKQGQNRTYARCPDCYPYDGGISSGEEDVQMFIEEVYKGNVVLHDRCLSCYDGQSHKYEIDIKVPDKKLGIEYDGMFYHSERNGVGRNYHLMKTETAESQGLQLVHIFELEWMHKKNIVKSRLKNLLGVYDNVVYARNTVVRTIGKSETAEFLERCHMQGWCTSSINLGLFHCGKLVSVMTFGKSRYDKKYDWELLRFCNELGYHVIGGAGKLLKFFERNYHPGNLISYADRRWSKGNLYERLGFRFIRNTKPNYWYFKGKKMFSRIKFQKHKLKNILKTFDKSKSEWENMMENGYNRIFDCGNMVFAKDYH